MVISVKAEKAPGKIQHPFLIKTLSTLGIQGHFPKLSEGIHEMLSRTQTCPLTTSIQQCTGGPSQCHT